MGLTKLLISSKKRHEMQMLRIIRGLIRSYSRGNAYLSLGKYITRKNAEKKEARVRKYKFI